MPNLFLIGILTILAAMETSALSCIACDWTPSSGSDACFNYTVDASIPSLQCAYADPYCRTQMTFTDGVLSSISRSCQGGAFDQDLSTDSMPETDECTTSFFESSSDVDNTDCYFSCNTSDSCNTVNPDALFLCNVDCGLHGKCDYITGTCACDDGWSGSSCTTGNAPVEVSFRSCVQCDSETEETCDSMTKSTSCPSSGYRYCSVSKTTTFNEDGTKKKRDFISRSCTDNFEAADECFITSSVLGTTDVEYTCVSSCDEDGCNTGTPDGMVDAEDPVSPLKCVVCDSTNDPNCQNSTAQTVCSSKDRFCTSQVTYFLSEKTDISYNVEPAYQLVSVVRGCSENQLTRQCSTSFVQSTSMNKVVCQDSCGDDGCNTGWPARPKCSQCVCSACASDSSCNINPPIPTSCDRPYHEYCTMQDVDRPIVGSLTQYGYPRNIVRGCSYKGVGNTCTFSKYSNQLESCNTSCTEDGCNLGYPVGVLAAGAGVLSTILCFFLPTFYALALLKELFHL